MTHVLENERVRAVIEPSRGARLAALSIDGHDLLADDGCFPMIPWAGRIRDGLLHIEGATYELPLSKDRNAIHGLGRNAEWTSAGDDAFELTIGAPWPTSGIARLHYLLLPDGLRTELSWADNTDMPCSMGLHPWFNRRLGSGDDAVMSLDIDVMVERGEDGLPTGALVDPRPGPWDDCFRLDASPVLTWPGALELRLRSSTDWWVVYDEPAETVCVEPQTAPPDAFDHPSLKPDGGWPRSLWLEMRGHAL